MLPQTSVRYLRTCPIVISVAVLFRYLIYLRPITIAASFLCSTHVPLQYIMLFVLKWKSVKNRNSNHNIKMFEISGNKQNLERAGILQFHGIQTQGNSGCQ